MEQSFQLTLQIVITVFAGITAQVIAAYLKVPSIVFLLLFGILLGSDGLDLLQPHRLGVGLEVLVALSVAIILFEGGLNLELSDLGKVSGSLRNLVTIGTLITLIGGGIAAHSLAEFPWAIAFLYASLIVVTGPTVISPLLKQVKVDRQVATILEGEGVLIDPIGAILAVVVLNTILNSNATPVVIVGNLLLRLGIGAAIGVVGGWLLGLIVKRVKFIEEDLKNLIVLAGVWSIFGLSQLIRSESGLMATVMAGIMINASAIPQQRLIRRFKGQLTTLCVSVLFILLAADLSLASVFALGWGSVLTVLTLMLLVRPLSIGLCTFNSDLNWRQKLFLAWIAPRGIVSASVASLFAILLTEQGINGGDATKALVFLTIIMTVFFQGLTASWVANWLGVSSSSATGAVIIGSNPLGRLIARLFQEQNESVVIIDSESELVAKAKAEGLNVIESSALDPKALEEAGVKSMGTFAALTTNGELNLVLAQKAIEEFSPPRVLAVVNTDADTTQVNQAFIEQVPIKIWNDYLQSKQVKLGKTVLTETELSFQIAHLQALIRSGELLPLIVQRDQNLRIATPATTWQAKDEIIYLLHDPRPKLLKRLSGENQASRLVLEKLPKVEEISVSTPTNE